MKKSTVDTPRKGAWCTQVNRPGFIPAKTPTQRVILKTLNAQEGIAAAAVFNGKG